MGKLYEHTKEGFKSPQVADLAEKGDDLIAEQGGLYHAICGAQGKEMELLEPQTRFVEQHAYLFPHMVEQLIQVLQMGVLAQYDGGAPRNPRTMGISLSGERPGEAPVYLDKDVERYHEP